MFPFALKYFEETRPKGSGGNWSSKSKNYRFQVKTNVYLKPPKNLPSLAGTTSYGNNKATSSASSFATNSGNQKNVLYQFNLSSWDEDVLSGDTAVVQIILINRQQRVKLVFSQPIDRVVRFQDEFQAHISKLTGYKAYIDKVCLFFF